MTDKKERPKRNPNLRAPWKPGQSANPRGRPPRDVQQSALLARIGDHGDEALDTIIQVMRKTRPSPGDNIKLKAATDVLDRIVGRPTQSLAASVIQRTVAADGTLIEGSAMMSPLLQAAQAHFVEEEMRQLAAPKTEPEPETSRPPSLPEFIALPDESVVPSESAAPESTTPPTSVQIPEKTEPAPEASPSKPPTGIPADAAAFMALKAKEREAQQEERRKQLPGGQIPAKDWFQPDPQEGPEIVRFTRIPGGRGIRRC
jgi:hypothetical protein